MYWTVFYIINLDKIAYSLDTQYLGLILGTEAQEKSQTKVKISPHMTFQKLECSPGGLQTP